MRLASTTALLPRALAASAALCFAVLLALPPAADAARPHGSGGVRATASGNVNRTPPANRTAGTQATGSRSTSHSRSVERNVNVDREVHVDVEVDGHGHGCCFNDPWDDHPVATAAAVTTAVAVTAAAIGSIVYSVPPSCSQVVVNGIAYQQCGSTWYQPQYAGTTVQYVVVNPPR